MSALIRVGMIILGVLAAGLLAATPAAAGGPTSVLIVNPAHERTSSAYTGDARYERLAGYVGIDTGAGVEQPSGGESPPDGIENDFGSEIRLTWLIHDMSVWRVDQIYLGPEEVWIHTTQTWDDSPNAGVWHRATQPNKLQAALAETGVLLPASPGPTYSEPDAAPPPATAAAAATAGGPPLPLTGTLFGLLGVAVGIAGTLVFRQARRPRPERIVLKG
ncbi:hypothetical protein [Microlunatus sp. GCM10028923]|uniref:hypothetical protein n=1 Tax=Microlunatus sp. GCM10028923 TaxID=3273400 RepID=UPI00361E8B57